MNTKDNKQNRVLVTGTMAFDEIITQSASSGRVIGGAATYISYSSSFFSNNIYVSSIIGNDFPLSFLEEMNSKGISTEMIEIAKEKMVDLNAHDIEQASKIIAGSARSMGIEVKD